MGSKTIGLETEWGLIWPRVLRKVVNRILKVFEVRFHVVQNIVSDIVFDIIYRTKGVIHEIKQGQESAAARKVSLNAFPARALTAL
jgi:hypothetical protein